MTALLIILSLLFPQERPRPVRPVVLHPVADTTRIGLGDTLEISIQQAGRWDDGRSFSKGEIDFFEFRVEVVPGSAEPWPLLFAWNPNSDQLTTKFKVSDIGIQSSNYYRFALHCVIDTKRSVGSTHKIIMFDFPTDVFEFNFRVKIE